jgi:hypothetical protein
MSTQFDTRDQQATSHEVTGQQATRQQATRQQATGTSWIRIWAVVIGTAVAAASSAAISGLDMPFPTRWATSVSRLVSARTDCFFAGLPGR